MNNIEEFGALLNLMKKGELWDVGIVWSDIYGEHQGYTRLKVR